MDKWYLNSTTIRGALVATLPTLLLILRALGVSVESEEANTIIDALAGLAGAVSVVLVIVGRQKAQARLVSLGGK